MADLRIADLYETPASLQTGQSMSLLGVRSDAEAVALWIRQRGGKSQSTRQAYARVGTRFLIWLDLRKLVLKAVSLRHVEDFYNDLRFPPLSFRMAYTSHLGERHSLGAAKDLQYTRTVLAQLYQFLQDAGYVVGNPFRLSQVSSIDSAETKPHILSADFSYLDFTAWQHLWDSTLELPANTQLEKRHARRARMFLALAYHTGMRRDELRRARMSDFFAVDGCWRLSVVGKRNKQRWVTVNSALLSELKLYREQEGYQTGFPASTESGYVLPKLRLPDGPLTNNAIDKLYGVLREHALRLTNDDTIKRQIQFSSTHSLRHTCATHRLRRGASLQTIKEELGHSSIKTTEIYAQVADSKRRKDAELTAC